jgi:GxxExxY protein
MADNLAHGGDLTCRIIGLAMRVHRNLGPGLLESIYAKCLAFELAQAGLPFEAHVPIAVRYGEAVLEGGYVADMIIDNQVILELKSVEKLMPVHEAQLLTYLRLSGCEIGLLINFNTASLTDGIRRKVM